MFQGRIPDASRIRYWSHAAGTPSRRKGIRWADTAADLVPLVTEAERLEKLLLIDIATHPRLNLTGTMERELEDGVYLTEAARSSLPLLSTGGLRRVPFDGGHVWRVTNVGLSFLPYWRTTSERMVNDEARRKREAALNETVATYGRMPLNHFPVDGPTIPLLWSIGILTVADLARHDTAMLARRARISEDDAAACQQTVLETIRADRNRKISS